MWRARKVSPPVTPVIRKTGKGPPSLFPGGPAFNGATPASLTCGRFRPRLPPSGVRTSLGIRRHPRSTRVADRYGAPVPRTPTRAAAVCGSGERVLEKGELDVVWRVSRPVSGCDVLPARPVHAGSRGPGGSVGRWDRRDLCGRADSPVVGEIPPRRAVRVRPPYSPRPSFSPRSQLSPRPVPGTGLPRARRRTCGVPAPHPVGRARAPRGRIVRRVPGGRSCRRARWGPARRARRRDGRRRRTGPRRAG